jgi:hypothetical protein
MTEKTTHALITSRVGTRILSFLRASSFDRSSVLICGLNEIRQAQVRIADLGGLASPLLQHNVLKVSPVREQINPVQCEQSDD